MGQFNLIFECEECKKKFPIVGELDDTTGSITHKKEFKSNGQSIFLTYYDCPQCGKRHFVQIDDISSLRELVRVTCEFRSLMAARGRGKSISKKQSEKFKKSRQHLSDYRMNLMKEFTGKIAVDETGIEYVLRFSV